MSRELETQQGKYKQNLNAIDVLKTKTEILLDVNVSPQMANQFEKIAAIPLIFSGLYSFVKI